MKDNCFYFVYFTLFILIATVSLLVQRTLLLLTSKNNFQNLRACATLMPGHGYNPQTNITDAPATLKIHKTYDIPGQDIKITVEAKEGRMFKGVIIQARNKAKPDERVGTFRGTFVT